MIILLNPQQHQQDCSHEFHYGERIRSYENARRLDSIFRVLSANDLHRFEYPEDYGDSLINKVHDPGYLHFLQHTWDRWAKTGATTPLTPSTWSKGGLGGAFSGGESNAIPALLGRYSFAADAAITAGTWTAVYNGAQATIAAQKAVIAGSRAAFALTRPPGHHAHRDLCGGYCFINNAAVAAEGFLEDGKMPVAIVDIDFHHGNGTQDIFYARNDVITVSLHGNPEDFFPFYLGFANEIGTGEGTGFNRNFPMPAGTRYDTWNKKLESACELVQRLGAQALVIPFGVDTYENDPLGGFGLTTEDYTLAGKTLASLNLPTVITMEGGYDFESIGANVAGFIQGFDAG